MCDIIGQQILKADKYLILIMISVMLLYIDKTIQNGVPTHNIDLLIVFVNSCVMQMIFNFKQFVLINMKSYNCDY